MWGLETEGVKGRGPSGKRDSWGGRGLVVLH